MEAQAARTRLYRIIEWFGLEAVFNSVQLLLLWAGTSATRPDCCKSIQDVLEHSQAWNIHNFSFFMQRRDGMSALGFFLTLKEFSEVTLAQADVREIQI